MTNLTKHFTLEELIYSSTAIVRKIDNTPSPEIIKNLTTLAISLEAIRALLGKPVKISSGYRCLALNEALGSASKTSAHMQGRAADIKVVGMTPYEVCTALKDSGIVYDQLICEPSWTHFGISLGTPRKQVLTMKRIKGKTVYLQGILE